MGSCRFDVLAAVANAFSVSIIDKGDGIEKFHASMQCSIKINCGRFLHPKAGVLRNVCEVVHIVKNIHFKQSDVNFIRRHRQIVFLSGN